MVLVSVLEKVLDATRDISIWVFKKPKFVLSPIFGWCVHAREYRRVMVFFGGEVPFVTFEQCGVFMQT